MPINTDFVVRCINTLESAFEQLQQRELSDELYDIFRAASVKEFEIVLEQIRQPAKEAPEALFRQQPTGGQADLQKRIPARRQARPHLGSRLRAVARVSGQPERHRARLRRGVCRDDAQTAAKLYRRRQESR